MNGTNTNTDIPDEFSGVQQSNGVDIKEDNNKVVDNDDVVLKKLPMEAEELKKEGVLLWAKIRGYSFGQALSRLILWMQSAFNSMKKLKQHLLTKEVPREAGLKFMFTFLVMII